MSPPESALLSSPFGDVSNQVRSSDDLKEMRRWAHDKQRALAVDPLNHSHPPYPYQLDVHRSTADEILVIAGNRVGKTTLAMREVLWRATGTHPYKKIRQHEVVWCGFLDFPFYNKVTKRHFDLWYPRNYLLQHHESEKWARFRRKDGGECTLYFLSYESGREAWQGGKVDFCWMDEELPEEVYKEASARLIDSGGQMLLTQTPVSGQGWLYDQVYQPARAGVRPTQVVQVAMATRDESREFGVGESLIPHMSREKILRFARIIKDPDERDIRIFGEFKSRTGDVYKQFFPEVHVVPRTSLPPYWEVWGGVDPGYHGFAACLLAMDPRGRAVVVEEYFSQEEHHSKRLQELWQKVSPHLSPQREDEWVVFYCDTANPQDILELNTWAGEAEVPLAFAPLQQGLKAREAGVQRVQEYLALSSNRTLPEWVERARSPKGEPLLYFFDDLASQWREGEEGIRTSRMLWEVQRYAWPRPRKTQAHPSGPDDKSAGGAHMVTALRYAMMARIGAPPEPEVVPPRGQDRLLEHMRELEDRLAAHDHLARLA